MKIQYFAPLVAALCVAAGCAADMNYNEYVSESRHGLYLYEDDGMSIKLCLKKKRGTVRCRRHMRKDGRDDRDNRKDARKLR